MKILIAEDDPVSRSILEKKLTIWGYEVISAKNGVEALNILKSDDSPKIVLLDWMMPEMDGVEVCRQIRKDSKEPYSFIILLTAKGLKEDIVKGMEAGADDYITKCQICIPDSQE